MELEFPPALGVLEINRPFDTTLGLDSLDRDNIGYGAQRPEYYHRMRRNVQLASGFLHCFQILHEQSVSLLRPGACQRAQWMGCQPASTYPVPIAHVQCIDAIRRWWPATAGYVATGAGTAGNSRGTAKCDSLVFDKTLLGMCRCNP